MKKRFLIPFVVACFAFSSCSNQLVDFKGDGDTEKADGFFLSHASLNLDIGGSEFVTASIPEEYIGQTLEWRVSGMPGIISISETKRDGMPAVQVIGLKKGSAMISAVTDYDCANCTVTVAGGSSSTGVPVESISLTPSEKRVTLEEGAEYEFTITATISPAQATNKEVSWSSSNSNVAVIASPIDSTKGNVTVRGTGTAVITATAQGNKTATCTIYATAPGEEAYVVTISETSKSLQIGQSYQLSANASWANSFVWKSNDPSVADVGDNGLVTAYGKGQCTISVTAVGSGDKMDTKTCTVTVTAPDSQQADEYERQIATWSKPGHLYIHYLRDKADYENWAVWIWQKKPDDSSGSLWGATLFKDKKPAGHVADPMSYSWMTNGDISEGGDSNLYTDAHGEVLDIDLTNENIVSGETGKKSPLIKAWDEDTLFNSSIGFLIVNQTKMNGGSHWTSDGGIESYIEDLDLKFPEGQGSFLHIYCVQGSVSSYTTSSGAPVTPNPTATDTTGKYSSKNDIANLLADNYSGGVSTSDAFQSSLDERPGIGYQIFVPSFADSNGDGFGDIKGITEKLDYLEDLGVSVLWLTPIQKSGSYHGYDVTDYYRIDSKYGSLEDYQELLFKAHQKGMKVLMDMVINHTSKNNVLFTKSQKAEVDEARGINYRNMYLWKFEGELVREWDGVVDSSTGKADPANYKDVPVEEASDWYQDGDSKYYYYGKFGSGMAELNYSCQATRDYMTDMCKYWLSFGLDGFRLDAIKHIYLLSELSPEEAKKYDAAPFKTSEDGQSQSGEIVYDASWRTYYDNQKDENVTAKNDYSYHRALNVKFWKDFAGTIKAAYPNCFLVGENFDGWNARISSFYEAMDSQFDFSTYYHLNGSTAAGNEVANMGGDIQSTLNWYRKSRSNAVNGAFTSNHDVARFINHAASTTPNVHHVEVEASKREQYEQRARWFAAITLLTPGVSWIYYGDEIGLSGNLKDKVTDSTGQIVDDHGNNTDRWYRQPMRWGRIQGQDKVTSYAFSGLEVNWDKYNRELPIVSEQQANVNSLYNYFKALCHAKNDSRFPTYGYIANQWREANNANFLCMQITDGYRTVNVFVNATNSTQPIAGLNQGEYIGGSVGSTNASVPAWGFVVVKK